MCTDMQSCCLWCVQATILSVLEGSKLETLNQWKKLGRLIDGLCARTKGRAGQYFAKFGFHAFKALEPAQQRLHGWEECEVCAGDADALALLNLQGNTCTCPLHAHVHTDARSQRAVPTVVAPRMDAAVL